MPSSRFSSSFSSPDVSVTIDMGNPFLNRTVDGFLKIGTIAAARVGAEEMFHCIRKGSISEHKLEHSLKKMCKEGAYWGTVAGVYVGMEYGMERIRGTRDWKNAMLGGAVSGALISAVSNSSREKVVVDAITGAAVATAAEFLHYLT
ncbi:outer envelope pore protein 16, chloroplastic-like [Macadamia integrifolia]|uniref:outer envelope pore protein 16, chloroplastic-like n=1 Tax=Macadamia integrifolia TaxID=60698 RepID=UPI001C4E62C6|nr:outer envelope pore protein 16, chloroplastic-like [Macadamia integrifolia]XP_042512108.1 outer envelope pore protein 16, chloroplastic-like [Macadamia integrifolia]XP_042512109.1 outer envelope pore protein 16, chloroplastic-like [Macadamia integrifolia]